ncbi:MAG: hypothetical protein IPK78_17870 [Rhodospirillales bacterium]|nr:hypothetical protein [Rhodospirillales bacterium]
MAVALVSLSVAVVFALALTADYQFPLLAEHRRVALAHAVLTSFGFMGMLVFAFSHILIPMFAVAEAPAGSVLDWTLALLAMALAGAVAGCLCAWPVLTSVAGGVGLVGALLHVAVMAKTVERRVRKRMGPEFVLIRVSWCMLLVGILLATALPFGLLSDTWPAVTIVVVAYGWLLTFLLGVLQRILPFLASMHTARSGPGLLSPSRLTVETAAGPPLVSFGCSCGAGDRCLLRGTGNHSDRCRGGHDRCLGIRLVRHHDFPTYAGALQCTGDQLKGCNHDHP